VLHPLLTLHCLSFRGLRLFTPSEHCTSLSLGEATLPLNTALP